MGVKRVHNLKHTHTLSLLISCTHISHAAELWTSSSAVLCVMKQCINKSADVLIEGIMTFLISELHRRLSSVIGRFLILSEATGLLQDSSMIQSLYSAWFTEEHHPNTTPLSEFSLMCRLMQFRWWTNWTCSLKWDPNNTCDRGGKRVKNIKLLKRFSVIHWMCTFNTEVCHYFIFWRTGGYFVWILVRWLRSVVFSCETLVLSVRRQRFTSRSVLKREMLRTPAVWWSVCALTAGQRSEAGAPKGQIIWKSCRRSRTHMNFTGGRGGRLSIVRLI